MVNKSMVFKTVSSICLVVLTLFMLIPGMSAALFEKEENVPSISAFSKNATNLTEIPFSTEDFTSRLSENATLDGVFISEIPDPSLGMLKLEGREVLRGDGITREGLDHLTFAPSDEQSALGSDIFTAFSFIPVFEDGVTGDSDIPVGINISKNENSPPIAEDLSFETYENVSVVEHLIATDPEGDPMTFRILDSPKMGLVTVNGSEFSYTPFQNKTGNDAFTYTVSDSKNNTSEPKRVKIRIDKQKDKNAVSYLDMEGSPAHYAAIKLAEAGIFTGERIGEDGFIHPTMPVSRAEFTALAVTIAELEVPIAALSTGLSDDGDTPTWAKSYIGAALKAGVVSGSVNASGEKAFRPDDPITRAEATVILNNVLNLEDRMYEGAFSDEAEIPAWAIQSAANVGSEKIISLSNERTLRPNEALTREEAIRIIYNASQMLDSKEEKSGLFSWLF